MNSRWIALCVAAALTTLCPPCQDDRNAVFDAAEERLRAIYERGEFRARRFLGEWLPDSAAYTVGRGNQRRKFEVATGDQLSLTAADRRFLEDRANRSPVDSGLVVRVGQTGLLVEGASDGRTVRLVERVAGVNLGNVQWSPDGQYVSFVESDSRQVRQRNVLEPTDPSYPEAHKVRFARVAETIRTLRVGVVSANGGAVSWLDLPKAAEGCYLGETEWVGPNEFLVEVLSRFRDERSFFRFDVGSGGLTKIYGEKDDAWVVASYGVNIGLEWIEDGAAFLLISERDGWRQAHVHDRDGKKLRTLTPPTFDIIERVAVDHERGLFYFLASPDNAAQRYLYRVELDGSSPPERVTPAQPGTHSYSLSPNARWAFHTWSAFDKPPVTELVELPGHRVVRVLQDDKGLNERAANLRRTEFLQIALAGDITLDAWLMRPKAFDPAKKYPVVVYVYSEPHAQTVVDRWGAVHADYHRLIADLGYLVLSIDSRGTPAPKGAAWRRAVAGSLGPLSTAEQAAALEALARKRAYVDLERVGIWGWSGGGSNTLNAMFRRPDLYDVGIAVAAKPQPHLYNAWFQEIYMRTREVNAEGYARSAPINFAEGLRGDLLIIHGTGERNTHVQIIEGLVDRLIGLGKRFDYTTYPNRGHGLRAGKGTAVHLRSQMVRYWLDHLPPGARVR